MSMTQYHDEDDNDDDDDDDRLHEGTILKFHDGKWITNEGLPPPKRLLAVAFVKANVRWAGRPGRPVETVRQIGSTPLPKVSELNAAIPEGQWEIGLNDQPRPPWERQSAVYLIDLVRAEKFTFATGSIGGSRAIRDLRDKVDTMRQLKGGIEVRAVVEPATAPFQTKYGMRVRPHFNVLGWLTPSGGGGSTGGPTLVPLAPLSVAEEIDDSLPPDKS